MRIVGLALALLAAVPLAAHDFWIKPSSFSAAPGQRIAVHLFVGEKGIGDPVPRLSNSILSFVVRHGDEESPVYGREGGDPAGYFLADGNGWAQIAYRTRPSPIVLDATRFEQYLTDKGLDDVIAIRARRGETRAPGRERFFRFAKSLVVVGRATGNPPPLGLRFEIVCDSDPRRKEPLRVRLVYEAKPLARAIVTVCDDDQHVMTARTDAAGRASFDLPHEGMWIVTAVHMIPSRVPATDWDSLWASLTFQR